MSLDKVLRLCLHGRVPLNWDVRHPLLGVSSLVAKECA
jgi:hypothetical protein